MPGAFAATATYHLGQVLFTGKDFVIIDFEGEPERPVSERRIKASPLRDVAGMLRSLHYVSHAALRGKTPTLFVESASIPIEQWATFWYDLDVGRVPAELSGAMPQPGGFLPADQAQLRTLARRVPAGESAVRAALRAQQPAGLGKDSAGRHSATGAMSKWP